MRNLAAALAFALASGMIPGARAAETVTSSTLPVTQTVLPLAPGSDAILGSNKNRRYLCVMNIGTGLVTLAFDQAAVAGSGWALDGAATTGRQGGAMCWEASVVVNGDVHAISAAGSTVAVIEAR